MQYSYLLAALPVASAILLDKRDPAQYDQVVHVQATEVATAVATTIVTVTVGAGPTPDTKAQAWGGNGNPFQYGNDAPDWAQKLYQDAQHHQPPSDNTFGVYNHEGYHRHHHGQPPAAAPKAVPAPVVPAPQPEKEAPAPVVPAQPKKEAPPPAPVKPQPAPKKEPPVYSGGGGGGCPADNSNQMSEGVNGHPARNMVDSMNEIRRLYNPNAPCLGWSETLAQASEQCANIRSESALRANSGIVSDPGYQDNESLFPLAKTKFENSMYLMLCQADGDPQLQGKCPFKMGEVGCTPDPNNTANPNCTGHRDMIVDVKGEFRFMGAACNEGQRWMSTSYSKTNNVFD